MVDAPAPVEEDLFDGRIVEKNIERGFVTREAYEAYLASLEDTASLAEESTVRMVAHHDQGH